MISSLSASSDLQAKPSRPLRIALVGVGGYAANHVRIAEAMEAEGRLQIVAVADPTTPPGDLKQRLDSRGTNWFEDYRRMLEKSSDQLDAIVISTPIPLHLPMLEAALDRNLTVYLEKPPIPLIQDFLRVAARPESARVAVDFQRIAEPNLWRLKRAILAGSLGKLRRLHANASWPRRDAYYSRAGWAGKLLWNGMPALDGPATNALAHIVHNLTFLGGRDVTSFGVPENLRGELYRARPIESYDLCCMAGEFENGIRFDAAFSHCVEHKVEWSITAEGDRGKARLTEGRVVFDTSDSMPASVDDAVDIFKECWENFYQFATVPGTRPLTSLDDCLGYVSTTNALFVSSGAIHPIPTSQRYGTGESGGFDVPEIPGLILELERTGKLFSEQGVRWARAGRNVDSKALREFRLADFLGVPV